MLPVMPESCPLSERHVTLVCVEKDDVTTYKNKGEKQRALDKFFSAPDGKGQMWLVAWTGQWSTDLFSVDTKGMTRLLADIGLGRR